MPDGNWNDDLTGIEFEDLFQLNDIQRIQDDFSAATGVASIITHVDGTPITRPSNFCKLCIDIIRNTEKGAANCYKSDAALGVLCPDGPIVQPCLSGGLWDAGAGIAVGGRHIANWLIGQVRDETQADERMRAYAREIGTDEQAFLDAFKEVPSMSKDKFEKIAKALHTLANQLSTLAYHNVQQVRFIEDRKRMDRELRIYANRLEEMVEERTQSLQAANEELSSQNEEMTALNEETIAMNEALSDANRQLAAEIDVRQQKEHELLLREKQYRATTTLLNTPGEDIDGLLEAILRDAVQLVGAPGGSIGLEDESGKTFVIRRAVGANIEEQLQTRPVDQGMLGQVYISGDILCVEDYRQYPLRLKSRQYEQATTVIMVPLKIAGRVTGALAVNWQNEVHPIATEDVEVLRQFGVLASIALDRAHATRQIANQNLLLQRLAETTTALVNELDVEKVLQNILDQAASFMGIPHGFIQLFDAEGQHAIIKCGLGHYTDQIGRALHIGGGKGIFLEIIRTGRLVVVDDYGNWPHRLKGPFYDEVSAAMQAPLNIEGRTIGSIGLTVMGEPVQIAKEKLSIFEQFATVAAIAIKNALAHQRTNHLAFHDTLTGLPNRAHLNRRLTEEMGREDRTGAVGAVLFIDLDDLKTVNDHFGHTCGDSMIVAAGADIVGAAGEDAFVARVGGDEFIVILPGEENLKRIAQVTQRILAAVNRDYEVGGQRVHMSTSIGVTQYPADGNVAEEILKNADIAMYAAKAAGKNCWRFYEPEMQKDTYSKMVLTNSLRRALENKELSLHYQPQISLSGRQVVGFEALLRWTSKEHGVVPPDRFVPLAEHSGLIQPIGQWVMEEACRFARILVDMGRGDLHVAVNVSPRQLAAEDFVDAVRQCIVDARLEPGQMEVEITENVLIDSLEESTKKLVELSRLGVRLSLDDFGTGFSSLTYLRNLPVGTLKIDKSFIASILEDKVQEGFVRSIIDMAHVLGLNVVAEGVETELQLQKLALFGCDCVQGYVFSRPIPQEEAVRFTIQG